MSTSNFDHRHLNWHTIDGFDHIAYHVCEVDERNRSVDVLLKFAANERILLHRHMAAYRTLVLEGELRIYEPSGDLKEVRPTGSYVSSPAGGQPHTEGGGDEDAIVFFSNRNVERTIYEVYGPEGEIVATFGLAEFKALLDAQPAPPPTRIKA